MLEKITNSMKSHVDTMSKAKELCSKALKDIERDYAGKLKESKLAEAKENYSEALKQSIDINYSVSMLCLDNVKAKVESIISKPINSELINTLEALKNIKNPTPTELEALTQPFKSNYLSYRAICDTVKQNKEHIVSCDDIFEDIGYLKKYIKECYYLDINSYKVRLLLDGAFIKKYDDKFTAFIDCRFDDATDLYN